MASVEPHAASQTNQVPNRAATRSSAEGSKATSSPNRVLDTVIAERRRSLAPTTHLGALDALEHGLSGFQMAIQFRPDFGFCVTAIAIRSAVEAALPRLTLDPEFDIDGDSREIVTIFNLAIRAKDPPWPPSR